MDIAETVAQMYTRPDWVRRINAMGESVGGAQFLIPMDVDSMEAAAQAATGLDDFGDFDGDWRGRLEALVADLEANGKLNTMGRLMTRQEIQRCLCTRLQLTDRLKQQPAIKQEVIEQPMVIAGGARAGTSILLELLSLDPNARGVKAHEAIHPFLSAEQAIPLTEAEQEFWSDVQPEMATIHELSSTIPVECITFQTPGFSGGHWYMIAALQQWFPDFAASMDYHKVFLQMLQHDAAPGPNGKPRTWVLKTPFYLMMLDLVWATYPDAWVILPHRDPVKTEASGASTLATARWLRSDDVRLSETNPDGMVGMMLDLVRRREGGELPDRIIDSHFSALMKDPVATVRGIYDKMERKMLPEHAEAIRDYIANKPKDKHGKHKYSPEQWGFDPVKMRQLARPYTDYHNIALEG